MISGKRELIIPEQHNTNTLSPVFVLKKLIQNNIKPIAMHEGLAKPILLNQALKQFHDTQ